MGDRSQLGSRDSEFCLLFDSEPYAKSLRSQLWRTFTGEDMSELKPNSEKSWSKWKSRAEINAESLEKVFCKPPSNKIKRFADLEQYKKDNKPLIETNRTKAMHELQKVKGVLVSYPIEFLQDEWLHPLTLPPLAKEK